MVCLCLERNLGSYGLTEEPSWEYISTQHACPQPVLVTPPDPQELRTSSPSLSPATLESEAKENYTPLHTLIKISSHISNQVGKVN